LNDEKTEEPRLVRFKTILKELRIVFRVLQNHSRLVEKQSGLSSAQLWVMWELFNEPGMKVSELAKVLSIHQSTCSNMLDKLQERDLVRRDRGAQDQRVVKIYLTEKAMQLLAASPRPSQGAVAEALLNLPDRTLDNLEAGLTELVAMLKTTDEQASMTPLS
jgi:DNA-binding MarR family transcriptional regulator